METPKITDTANGRRARWLAAVLLVLLTAAAGLAARGTTGMPALLQPGAGRDVALHYTAPKPGPVRFTGNLDRRSILVGGDGVVRVELVVGADEDEAVTPAGHVATDLLVILDTSGSMSGSKIVDARRAIAELLAQLGPEDRFALVTYNNDAQLALGFSHVTGGGRDGLLRAVEQIAVGGGTNMASGLDLGLDTLERSRAAGRTPHAIIISDGLANQGDASHEGLVGRAGRAARGEFMLTTIGVGADFDEYLMNAIADAGTGNYYYLEAAQSLTDVFVREFDAARATVASGLAIEIEPVGAVRVLEAAGYPLERSASAVTLRPGSLFAGQERRIWVTLQVPGAVEGDQALGRFSLSYTTGGERSTIAFDENPQIAAVTSEDSFFANVDVSTWERAVIVDEYNKLQEDVARKVKAGDRKAAMEAVSAFRDDVARYNAELRSAPVGMALQSLDKIEEEVDGAFTGHDQAAKQNHLSKTQSLGARDARRLGAKK